MKAVAFHSPLAITDPQSLVDVDLPKPVAKGRDLLVKVHAVSVNPVDTKVRKKPKANTEPQVLGWDAAGIVEAVGPDTSLFKPGDHVFYAGDITRPGTNSEFHLVDERIVGPKPKSLSFAEAAALPLTSITAYEALFDRLHVARAVPGAANAVLIVGGAGGVGSIAIQLAKQLSNLLIIATASRPETQSWVRFLGADHVVDHAKPLDNEVASLGIGQPAFVFITTQTEKHFDAVANLMAPQGRLVLIDDASKIEIQKLKAKSISVHWELMYTRSMFQTADMIEQHKLLSKVSSLVDAGKIKTTLGESFGKITAENLRRAHAHIESGTAKGKVVLEGF